MLLIATTACGEGPSSEATDTLPETAIVDTTLTSDGPAPAPEVTTAPVTTRLPETTTTNASW